MDQPKFKVDSRLAVLLSENYRSSESALKELIDNAWDADADSVRVTLPKPNTSDPIIVEDDGTGMTPRELQSEYLVVAKNRISTKGQFTISKKRKVKGRKGIGKFAGLVSAGTMKLETWTRGQSTSILLNKENLLDASKDLEELDLVPSIDKVSESLHGTRITLMGLNQNLKFPLPEKLRELLIRDYGRENSFTIHVNGEKLSHEHIQGETKTKEVSIEGVGKITLAFTVAETKKPFKDAGISLRVEGKVVGKPNFFGLDESDDFPKKVLGKIYGEVEADGLAKDVTADWGAIVENSKGIEEIKKVVSAEVREAAKAIYGQEIQLAQARLQKVVKQRLSELPEYKRLFAEKALFKLLQKYYDEHEERLEPIVNVVLESIERDEYYFIIDKIDKAKTEDIESFANALEESSLLEMSIMQHQLRYRLKLINEIELIAKDPKTLEKHIHQAVENRLWILGVEYSLKASNISLKRITEEYLESKYSGKKPNERPDLLLANDLLGTHTLIEFKRPSHTIVFADYTQAIAYRNDLMARLQHLEIILIGGKRDQSVFNSYTEKSVKIMTFDEIISNARAQYDWLIKQVFSKQAE